MVWVHETVVVHYVPDGRVEMKLGREFKLRHDACVTRRPHRGRGVCILRRFATNLHPLLLLREILVMGLPLPYPPPAPSARSVAGGLLAGCWPSTSDHPVLGPSWRRWKRVNSDLRPS